MKTTIRINDNLLKRVKKRAAEEGRTLTSLAEDGLLLVLSKAKPKQSKPIKLPVSGSTGGVLPGNDLNNSSAPEDAMSEP